jgi:signal transduction histidine kinase
MIALARQCAQALDRVRLQEAQRIAAERMSLLADASTVLAASLDLETTLRNVARLCVPTIASTCVVAMRVEGAADAAAYVAVAHVEPAREAILAPLVHKRVRAAGGKSPLFEALQKGRAMLAQSPRSALIPQGVEGIAPDALQGIVDELDIHAAILLPLVARGQVLGVIGLGRSGRAADFHQEDLAFGEELARRAALAVDNARLYRDAENAVRLREDFLSIAGHELKTPLTALQLQARSLERGARGDERTLEKLRVVVRQGHRLTKLVDQLLDVSRITGGKLSLDREEVDLASLVRDVAARFEDDLARSGSALLLHVEDNATGRWDRLRVDQVVTNLISNAIKYGQGHPIDVAVEGGSKEVVLRVRDRGMGVAPEHQARIFGRFERAVSSRHYGGFGLGLWIVRQIVEAHGGTIVVQSEPGEGSTFTVRLPRNTDERAAE